MVLMNASKKARHASSIVNQDFKGGDKKAGLPASVGRTHWMSIYLNGTSQNSNELRLPISSKTKVSRPVGMRYM